MFSVLGILRRSMRNPAWSSAVPTKTPHHDVVHLKPKDRFHAGCSAPHCGVPTLLSAQPTAFSTATWRGSACDGGGGGGGGGAPGGGGLAGAPPGGTPWAPGQSGTVSKRPSLSPPAAQTALTHPGWLLSASVHAHHTLEYAPE